VNANRLITIVIIMYGWYACAGVHSQTCTFFKINIIKSCYFGHALCAAIFRSTERRRGMRVFFHAFLIYEYRFVRNEHSSLGRRYSLRLRRRRRRRRRRLLQRAEFKVTAAAVSDYHYVMLRCVMCVIKSTHGCIYVTTKYVVFQSELRVFRGDIYIR